jgi:hypothetical protein
MKKNLYRILKRIHQIAGITQKYLFAYIVFIIFMITMGNKMLKIIKKTIKYGFLLLIFYFLKSGGKK